MRSLSHRLVVLTGMAAYAAFASGLTGSLHGALAHSHESHCDHTDHRDCFSKRGGGHEHHSHDDSANPECPTCYQLFSATHATPSLSLSLPHYGDPCGVCSIHPLVVVPATEDHPSIAPRAPPQA